MIGNWSDGQIVAWLIGRWWDDSRAWKPARRFGSEMVKSRHHKLCDMIWTLRQEIMADKKSRIFKLQPSLPNVPPPLHYAFMDESGTVGAATGTHFLVVAVISLSNPRDVERPIRRAF